MTASLQEHVHRFKAGIMLFYIQRLGHIKIPLSVGVLETVPPHETTYFMAFCGVLLLFPF